jgi:TolA-binding protein
VAITTLEQILDDYGSHEVAGEATLLLGNINYELRNYNEATRYWEQYLAKFKKEPLNRAAAQAGIASAYESQGDNIKAAEAFLAAIEEDPEGPMVPEYRTGAMRNFLALGQIEQAREQLDILEEDFSNTTTYRRAALLFAEKAHPGRQSP